MIEQIVYEYLCSQLSVPCYTEMPNTTPDEFVLIEKTGSSRVNQLNTATITIQSYSTSLYKSALLNESVKQAMDNLITLNSIGKSQLNSDYNFTDTSKRRYRYQAVYDLVF